MAGDSPRVAVAEPDHDRGRLSGPVGRAGRLALAVGGWIVLLLVLSVALFFLLGLMLAVVLLGSPPAAENVVPVIIVGVLLAMVWWLVARFVASARAVRRGVGFASVVLLALGTVWSVGYPDEALFLARTMAWGESDVHDYERFPARTVANAPPEFHFARNPSPELFETVEYTVDGTRTVADFEEFMHSSHTTSFIVIKDDAILYEGYFNGYTRDSIVTSMSVAKSVTSALVGIAIDEGYLGSVTDPVVKYLPEMRGRGVDTLTIRDLLLMSTGIRFTPGDEAGIVRTEFPYTVFNPYADDTTSYEYTNMRKLALGLPPSEEPVGAAFRYNRFHPLLLGLVLERTTGRSVSRYLQDKIWQPLGMEFPASWSLDSTKYGFEKMESGLNARAIDFAKFGILFLHNGTWNGRQLISRHWVAESTAPDPTDQRPWLSGRSWKDAGGYYKYMWWGMSRPGGGYDYTATGHLGQKIAIFPQDGIVIVRFGTDDEGVDSWDEVIFDLAARLR